MPDWIDEIAPNIKSAPYAEQAVGFIQAAAGLGDEPFDDLLRVLSTYTLYHEKEKIEKSGCDPIPQIQTTLEENRIFLEHGGQLGPQLVSSLLKEDFSSLEHATGEHYGNLFSEFDDYFFFEEPLLLLTERFERNGISTESFAGKTALDAGCGGGRYTFALKKMGFESVTGVDISTTGLSNAVRRQAEKGIDGVQFEEASVLNLPFENNSFDFVFSNGVLHHSTNLVKGIQELLRVLKPGGRGFLYLIEDPGGIYWDVIEILRCVLRNVDFRFARSVLTLLGVPPNRRFFILDHIMAPINIRSACGEIEAWLQGAGASDIRRLERGTDFDRCERVFQNAPFAETLFGIGEQRYFFRK